MSLFECFFTIASFFLGSIPTAYLIGKVLKGIDIRQFGSGNIGATNVFRVIGKGPGMVTLLFDVFKGAFPVLLSLNLFTKSWIPLIVGLVAVAGHTWSPFVKFKGGKGVATSCGIFLALIPIPTLISLGVFGLIFGLSRHVSLGSLSAAVALPIASFFFIGLSPVFYLTLTISILVIIRHIPNMRRLIRGEEFSASSKKEGKA